MQVRTGVLDCPPDEPLPAPGGQAAVRPHRQQRARHPRQAAGAGPQAGATQQKHALSGDNIVISDQPVRERRLVQLAGEQGYQHRGPGHGHREQDH